LRRAAAEAAQWPKNVRLSFNLSAVELCSERSAEHILELVRSQGLDPSRLQIEVTETGILADFNSARRNLSVLRAQGVLLVLDDFGAGYASISYLREMRFDAVKLDGSLLTAATPERGGLPLFKGVIDLCRAVALPCVAEHVETETQLAMLREFGCAFGQGFWLAQPMSAESVRQLLQSEIAPFGPARMLTQQWRNTA
jgi:EAL domain-containing protein (putative c-di-GMP-specific phosphodiesterase class I)